jgi:hypothetical protein
MSLWTFSARYDEDLVLASRALLLSGALVEQRDPERLSLTPGVATLSPDQTPNSHGGRERLALAVLVDAERTGALEPGRSVPLRELGGMFELVAAALGHVPRWLDDVMAFGVREPVLQLQCGDAVRTAVQGTAGVPLTWTGSSGFATAGHVGVAAKTAVHDAHGQVGQVAWANDPTSHGLTREADFAVVELAHGVTCGSALGPFARAGPHDDVFIGGPAGPTVKVLGYSQFWYLASTGGTLGDAYLTAGQITYGGDSGAAVTLNSGEVIGHVIGASPGITTIVQDLDFQLGEAKAALPGLSY